MTTTSWSMMSSEARLLSPRRPGPLRRAVDHPEAVLLGYAAVPARVVEAVAEGPVLLGPRPVRRREDVEVPGHPKHPSPFRGPGVR